jgi:3D (Asp-Asp-Asp) domain-containing protein
MILPKKWYFLTFVILVLVSGIFPFYLLQGRQVKADIDIGLNDQDFFNTQLVQEDSLLADVTPPKLEIETINGFKVIVTAYSSSIWETQGDPFITASGERVRDGIVANNLLSFGTKIRLPEIFGDKIFEVTDRMNSRKSGYHVDIWFPSRESALEFGAKLTEMEILKVQ